MDILGKHVPFVKEQMANQEKLARRYSDDIGRAEFHRKALISFQSLIDDIDMAQKEIDSRKKPHDSALRQLALTPDDLEGLPQELISELSISDADKLEFAILGVIEEAGGILTLDRILINLYRKTGEIFKRNALTSRIYRMIQKKLIFPVGTRKGIYSTFEVEGEQADIFDAKAAELTSAPE